ncbi:MAG TPA: CBS domain-containing protein [Vicinamibacterales bacterium]|nr:CBS domain-containing protein [Vicinamibacterales bacterium]
MVVSELMKTPPATCAVTDDLAAAAQLMRDRRCGFVPVIDSAGGVAGVLTDRDACLYAANSQRTMSHIGVREAMAHPAVSCFADENVKVALSTMSTHHVRRLPVVDAHGHLQGVLSIDDVIQAPRRRGGPTGEDVIATLKEIVARAALAGIAR